MSLPENGVIHRLDLDDAQGESDATIGNYRNCQHIASGICSEVYRHETKALKVITETHNINPHNSAREVRILKSLTPHDNVVKLIDTFHDSQKRLVLEFEYMPCTLANILTLEVPLMPHTTHHIATSLLSAVSFLHSQNIIHRDIKPTNILTRQSSELTAPGSIKLCDFGTAWHARFSAMDEPASHKVLEVGTTCYRAPETLFGNRSYDTSLDIWSLGCVLAECLRQPNSKLVQGANGSKRRLQKPLFESRSSEEDGNQLGLILSMFKTLGTPTEETWPEAKQWKTNPFGFWNVFEGKGWDLLLADAGGQEDWGGRLVKRCLLWESKDRITADEALEHLARNGPNEP